MDWQVIADRFSLFFRRKGRFFPRSVHVGLSGIICDLCSYTSSEKREEPPCTLSFQLHVFHPPTSMAMHLLVSRMDIGWPRGVQMAPAPLGLIPGSRCSIHPAWDVWHSCLPPRAHIFSLPFPSKMSSPGANNNKTWMLSVSSPEPKVSSPNSTGSPIPFRTRTAPFLEDLFSDQPFSFQEGVSQGIFRPVGDGADADERVRGASARRGADALLVAIRREAGACHVRVACCFTWLRSCVDVR